MNFIPPDVPLHIFDMDHTLIDNDCDVSWKTYLSQKRLVPITDNFWRDFHYAMYRLGRLDHEAFMNYQLSEFKGRSVEEMVPLLQEHFDLLVKDKVFTRSRELVEHLIADGRHVAILTGTNEAIAQTVQEFLDVQFMVGTQVEVVDGIYTGRYLEPYCYNHGKIDRAKQLLEQLGLSFKDAVYYGDSVTDVPIMEACTFAVAVNPVNDLRKIAIEKNWPVLEV